MANLVNNVLVPDGLPVVYDDTSAFVGTAPGPVIGTTATACTRPARRRTTSPAA